MPIAIVIFADAVIIGSECHRSRVEVAKGIGCSHSMVDILPLCHVGKAKEFGARDEARGVYQGVFCSPWTTEVGSTEEVIHPSASASLCVWVRGRAISSRLPPTCCTAHEDPPAIP